MNNLSLNWLIDEYMIFCRSRQLREKTMSSYEQALRLFEKWCMEAMNIDDVLDITESVIRRYINDIQERGKYTFYANDKTKDINFPDRRRDFQKPVSNATINNYIRNLRAFFNCVFCRCLVGPALNSEVRNISQGKDSASFFMISYKKFGCKMTIFDYIDNFDL